MGKVERSLTDWGDKGRHCRKRQEMWKEGKKDVIFGVGAMLNASKNFRV